MSYDLEFIDGNGEFGVLRLEGVGGEEDPWLLLLMGPVALILKPCHIARPLRFRPTAQWWSPVK